MRPLLLSPHNDDESLFAAFTLLREKPHVVVVLRSEKQAAEGVTAGQRETETGAAMAVLGCTWEQWPVGDLEPDWPEIERRMACHLDAPQVFAPAYERAGHVQHNQVALLAGRLFGERRVLSYLTYTPAGKSEWGTPVAYEPAWPALKLQALLCYRSQLGRPDQIEHFLRDQHEYLAG